MTQTKKRITSLVIFGLFAITLFTLITPCLAANITDAMKGPLSKVTLPGGGSDPETKALSIIGKTISAFLSLFGVIFLILTIYGGYKWMLASGRDEEVKKAKDIIRSAIIGLIIVLASYAITYFITTGLEAAVQ
ncbi:MAG: hypothetical protein WCW26_00385 [Candidatus Buchananbacteria bacterium]